MNSATKSLAALLLLTAIPTLCEGQCVAGANSCSPGIPRFVKAGGSIKEETPASRAHTVAIKFTIYDDAKAGNALWQEIQNVQVDAAGRYEVMLGVTSPDGMPVDIFSSGDPRWLGTEVVSPGSVEEPRTLMVSVPYAIEAADAQTLGGLPPSAFARVAPGSAPSASAAQTIVANSGAPSSTAASVEGTSSAPSTGTTPAIEGRVGPVNTIPKFSGGGLASSQITDAGGSVSMQNLANVLFADRYSGGVPDAVAACPANGCVIYALSPDVNLNLGTLDPGTKAITIYLGPYTFSVKQITLRKGLKIIGMGASAGPIKSPTCTTALPCNGTALQSTNGNNPVFVLPQTSNMPATNVHLSGFRVFASSGNTGEDGFLFDTSSTTNSGLWYSTIDDVYLEGFAGNAVHVKGHSNDFSSLTQWVFFNNVVAFRTSGGGNALKLEGGVFELRFRNCEFDGQAIGDGTDIYIGGYGSGVGGYPVSIVFEGLVAQAAATAVQLDGAANITFYNSHHEKLWGAYHITNNAGIGVHGLVITDSYFAGDVGINGGAGYELKIDTTIASGIVFAHNQMFGNPDGTVLSTNLASVVYQDNLYAGALNAPPTSGITTQLTPASTLNTLSVHSIGLNPSATPIVTIQSGLGPGEMVTFYTLGGAVTFAAGGNIDLMGATSINVNGSITFIRSDLGGSSWKPVSQWTPSSPAPATPAGTVKRPTKPDGINGPIRGTGRWD